MSKYRVILLRAISQFLTIIIFLSSCNFNKTPIAVHLNNYVLSVIDSFSVPFVGEEITAVDMNKTATKFLLLDSKIGRHIYETDLHGTVLNQFSPLSLDAGKLGKRLSNIGYFSDTSVIISADSGYYICNLSGKILKEIKAANPETVGGSNKRLRLIVNPAGDTIAASVFRSPWSYDSIMKNVHGSKAFINQMKFITFHDFKDNKYDILFSYPEGSLQKEYIYDFRESILFDYNERNGDFYMIYPPDPHLYIYSVHDNFIKPRIVPFFLKNYELPVKYKIGDNNEIRDYSKSLLVNGAIEGFFSNEDAALMVYRTGMPETAYDEVKTNEETGLPSKKYIRHYCILFKNNSQVSEDIPLPHYCYDIAFFKSADYIVMSSGNKDEKGFNKFYVARLIQ